MDNDAQQRRREGSRRAQSARERTTAAQSRGQQRKLGYVVVGAIVVAVAAIAAFFVIGGSGSAPTGTVEVPVLPGIHSPPYIYNQDIVINGETVRIPPSSGNHFPSWDQWGFLGEPLLPELVVHNLEHGAVAIWYQPGDPELAGKVNQLITAMGSQCIVAGSYSNMSFPIVATVWGYALPLDGFDEVLLRGFIDEYRGKLGPEAGLCRGESATGSMS